MMSLFDVMSLLDERSGDSHVSCIVDGEVLRNGPVQFVVAQVSAMEKKKIINNEGVGH